MCVIGKHFSFSVFFFPHLCDFFSERWQTFWGNRDRFQYLSTNMKTSQRLMGRPKTRRRSEPPRIITHLFTARHQTTVGNAAFFFFFLQINISDCRHVLLPMLTLLLHRERICSTLHLFRLDSRQLQLREYSLVGFRHKNNLVQVLKRQLTSPWRSCVWPTTHDLVLSKIHTWEKLAFVPRG